MKGLCDRCQHRADSRARCAAHRGQHGIICDPAPRAECKRHEGYGRTPWSKEVCDDYQEIRDARH